MLNATETDNSSGSDELTGNSPADFSYIWVKLTSPTGLITPKEICRKDTGKHLAHFKLMNHVTGNWVTLTSLLLLTTPIFT
jgi:hypothetical protein